MKKSLYQTFVYIILCLTAVCFSFFIYEMASSDGFNVYAIVCLILSVFCIILFVLNQVIYRRFKKRDASKYEQVECKHCHTMNPKKEIFCKHCGRNLY